MECVCVWCRWSTHWFKCEVLVPEDWAGKHVRLRWNSGGEAMVSCEFERSLLVRAKLGSPGTRLAISWVAWRKNCEKFNTENFYSLKFTCMNGCCIVLVASFQNCEVPLSSISIFGLVLLGLFFLPSSCAGLLLQVWMYGEPLQASVESISHHSWVAVWHWVPPSLFVGPFWREPSRCHSHWQCWWRRKVLWEREKGVWNLQWGQVDLIKKLWNI